MPAADIMVVNKIRCAVEHCAVPNTISIAAPSINGLNTRTKTPDLMFPRSQQIIKNHIYPVLIHFFGVNSTSYGPGALPSLARSEKLNFVCVAVPACFTL